MEGPPHQQDVSRLISLTDFCLDLTLGEPNENTNLTLLGKLITLKTIPTSVIRDIVTKAWNQTRSMVVEVQCLDKNIFIFKFKYEADLQVTFRKRP